MTQESATCRQTEAVLLTEVTGNNEIDYLGNLRGGQKPQGYSGSVYKSSGVSPSVLARDYKEPILILDNTK
jgi:hypothetical protein